MEVVFTYVKKCRAVQRNHFSSNMENHIIIGLFRGNNVMVQKNRMKEQRTIDHSQDIEERERFKKYTLVHLVQVAYTRGLTKQKKHIHMHALSQKEKHVWDGKSRFLSEVLIQVFGLRYWSEVLVHGFGPRY